MDRRPSLRHGLPYRWWASQGFTAFTWGVVGVTLPITFMGFLLLAEWVNL